MLHQAAQPIDDKEVRRRVHAVGRHVLVVALSLWLFRIVDGFVAVLVGFLVVILLVAQGYVAVWVRRRTVLILGVRAVGVQFIDRLIVDTRLQIVKPAFWEHHARVLLCRVHVVLTINLEYGQFFVIVAYNNSVRCMFQHSSVRRSTVFEFHRCL